MRNSDHILCRPLISYTELEFSPGIYLHLKMAVKHTQTHVRYRV